jgi:hypothetical protein
MTTVWIYVDTSKEVGDVDHLTVLRAKTLPKPGLRRTTRKALPLSMRFWNEPHWPPDRLRDGSDLGAGDYLACAGVAVGPPTEATLVLGRGLSPGDESHSLM